MLEQVLRNWWVVVLRGIAAIGFGIIAYAWPRLTVLYLVALFGAYAIINGTLAVVGSFSRRAYDDRWWVVLLEGALSIAAGVFAWAAPAQTTVTLLFIIAIWAISTGILAIVQAVALRKVIEGEMFLALSGVASVLFGGLLLARPTAGALGLLWLIAGFAIVFGALLLGFGARLFAMHRREIAAEQSHA
jgi:uncharacterized membrane protein HdeD (DUF308 family)